MDVLIKLLFISLNPFPLSSLFPVCISWAGVWRFVRLADWRLLSPYGFGKGASYVSFVCYSCSAMNWKCELCWFAVSWKLKFLVDLWMLWACGVILLLDLRGIQGKSWTWKGSLLTFISVFFLLPVAFRELAFHQLAFTRAGFPSFFRYLLGIVLILGGKFSVLGSC